MPLTVLNRDPRQKSISSISFGIVLYETPESIIRELLQSLRSAILYLKTLRNDLDYTIFLIDNSKKTRVHDTCFEGEYDSMKKLKIGFDLIHGHGNVGYGSAHNLVIEQLASDIHVILNPDVVIDERALLTVIDIFHNNRSVVMLSPSAINSDGEKQYLCKYYPDILTLAIRAFIPSPLISLFKKRLARYEMHDLPENKTSSDIPLVSGCCMFTDTKSLKQAGGFDEGYFLYFEDFDLSIRIKKFGSLVYAPSVQIRHAGGQAARKGLRHIVLFARSGFRFFSLHGWRFN